MQNKSNTVETASVTPEGTQHTPGPWEISYHVPNPKTCAPYYKVDSDHEGIAAVYENKANARLIAAAPDLLEALKQVHAILNQPWKDCDGPKTLQIAKADCAIASRQIETSIAKAEGISTPNQSRARLATKKE